MSNDFEYKSYPDDEWPVKPENEVAQVSRGRRARVPAVSARQSARQSARAEGQAAVHVAGDRAPVPAARTARRYPAETFAAGGPAAAGRSRGGRHAAIPADEAAGAGADDLDEFTLPEYAPPGHGARQYATAGFGVRVPADAGPQDPGNAAGDEPDHDDARRTGPEHPDGDPRTEQLIARGRATARGRLLSRHRLTRWRVIAGGSALAALGITLAVILAGGGAAWPASVATVKQEIEVACQNPNVASEPGQVNFACASDTRRILWVFSLLTSDDNTDYSDSATGRRGLEPITPAQGGEVAWSLNLHHPYDPASPADSLEVAARAINNIVGGATVTSPAGLQVVQPGLESSAGNCQRYTGSPALITRQGFPALCAKPVTSAAGLAALVSDIYKQWMVGAPATDAANAALLFTNAGNPGDPRVQAVLKTLAG